MKIHESAIVDKNAIIEEGVEIGPFSQILGKVKIGKGTKIGSNVIIEGKVTIGENNIIYHFACIGFLPQDVKYKGEESEVIIGNNNIIREFVTIHRASGEGEKTVVGDNCFLMAYVHLAHNVKIGNNIIIANGTQLAGYVEIHDNAFLSGGVLVHQFCRIGKYAMIRGRARLGLDVVPYVIADGVENTEVKGLNVVGLKRAGFTPERMKILKEVYRILFRQNLNTSQALEILERDYSQYDDVKYLIEFIKNSKRGIGK